MRPVFCLIAAIGCTGAREASDLAQRSSQPVSGCIPSGSEADINSVLIGDGAQAVLCRGAVFTLSNPVQFNAPNQRIYTEGFPTDGSRALLRIGVGTLAKAVDGLNLSGISIQNIQIDGNRTGLGHQPGGAALIQLGGAASSQRVQNVVAYEPRGWSLLHVFEGNVVGDIPQCQNATISDNTLGPSGNPDGRWADGISLACGNSTVTNNVITDATDGAIVVFGAPGSLIANNTIIAASRTLLGGILMVDFGPMNGNYTGTIVTNNVINASGAYIKVGFGMGPDIWGCPHQVNYGGTVTNNEIRGIHFGYGYPVNGVRDWTVTGNRDFSRHVGALNGSCGGSLAYPSGFQYQSAVSSALQPEYSFANVTHVLNTYEPAVLATIRPPSECGWLHANEGLVPGQSVFSCDGRFELVLQGSDGNLVLYQSGNPLWASGTVNQGAAEVIMQGDGNLVIYDAAGRPLWSTNTSGYYGANFAIQNDGNLVIYDASGVARWASGTSGH